MHQRPLVLALSLAVLPSLVAAQSADDVIAKNIAARGGLERWRSVSTLRVTGVVNDGGTEITTVQENKRPGKIRSEFTIQGMTGIQAYDGSTGWQIMPFGGRTDAEILAADDMKTLVEDADIEGPLVDWRNKHHKVEYLGLESVDGTDAHKLRVTRANGDFQDIFIDAEHYLEIRIESHRKIRGAEVETQTDLGNYEDVQGLMVPFLYETGSKQSTTKQKLRITRVEVDRPIDDARFSMTRRQEGAR